MRLSETSIRRPVLASMISAALVLFGVIGYTRLSVRELPDIDPPIISVSTTLPGANAQVVETAVTDVLEEELSTIQGLRTLSSSSSEENSQTTCRHEPSPCRTWKARSPPATSRFPPAASNRRGGSSRSGHWAS